MARDLEQFGKRLENYIDGLDIPKAQFAARVGVERAAVYLWIAGTERPDRATVQRFQDLLHLTGEQATELLDLAGYGPRPEAQQAGRRIHTGGGAYVEGGVTVEDGDFVGRDQVTQAGPIGVMGDHAHVEGGIHFGPSGDTFNMSGDFRGALLNIKSTLYDTTQHLGALPKADAATRAELQKLVAALGQALQQVPPDQAEDAEAVAQSAEQLVKNATAEKPNQRLIQISGDGLKQAAQNLAAVMPTVLAIATQIVAAVTQFVAQR